MEYGIIVAGFLVFGGLLMESWPELKLAWAERRFPNLTVTGGIIVAVGVLAEVILGIFITQRANRTQSAAKERVARAEQATAEANLARLKIEEQLFKPHVLMGDTLKEFLEIINAYTGRKRVDVFVYDQHIGDVRMLADSINSAFLVAGWNSKMWIGPDPRLVGHEVTSCVPHDERQLQELA